MQYKSDEIQLNEYVLKPQNVKMRFDLTLDENEIFEISKIKPVILGCMKAIGGTECTQYYRVYSDVDDKVLLVTL